MNKLPKNDLRSVPEDACSTCGGWSASGGMSDFCMATDRILGRTGCTCVNRARFKVPSRNIWEAPHVGAAARVDWRYAGFSIGQVVDVDHVLLDVFIDTVGDGRLRVRWVPERGYWVDYCSNIVQVGFSDPPE